MSQGEGGGRPSKFTPERRAAIVAAIAKSIPYEYAAEANGIAESRLYEWLKQGISDRDNGIDSDFAKFQEDIKKAELNRITKHIDKINAGDDKWVCDAWMLERRWWKHYSKSAPILDFESRLKKMEEAKGIEDGEANSGKTE